MKKRDDGRYEKRITLTNEDGTKKRVSIYGKNQKEIRDKETELIITSQKPSCNMTFSELAEMRLAFDVAQLSEDRLNTKRFRIEALSAPFKDKQIKDITIDDINNSMLDIYAVNPSTGKPSGKRTVSRYISAVSSVFEYGIRNRLIDYNPCIYVDPPKSALVRERSALTEAERNIILNSTDIRYLPAQMMILTGLRRGEVAALNWSDIDFKNKMVCVNKSYDYKENKIKKPKTAAGIRNVPIPEKLLAVLKSYQNNYVPIAMYDEEGKLIKTGKEIAPVRAKKTDTVIRGLMCERMTETAWKRLLESLQKETGIDFDWHSLRHTYASLLYEAGVDMLTAKELLGHSDIKTTISIYTHLSENGKKHSIEKLEKYLK
ncbi:MAG: site-specific integrase [Clostridia bacterium]|nr:site-specific integrase [Clostridia bacterium]